MKAKNSSIEEIIELTGLTHDEIAKLWWSIVVSGDVKSTKTPAIPAWQSSSTGSRLTNGALDCATDKEGSQNLLLSTTTSPSEFCQAGIADFFYL